MLQMTTYVNFKGDCEAAFKLYEQCLGAEPGPIFRYGGSPMEADAPPDWSEKIMHGSVTIGGQVLMGADIVPDRYEEPKGIQLSLQLSSVADAERIFRELSSGGRIAMPLEKTFWAERFGILTDRFGIPWLINCETPAQPHAS
ncbi:MAG TPA: glyoxalase/bleomycin resistance/extradiol dioxygenase family protein [Vicinamibacterales bacterium]|jgi:PhnB protein